MEFLDEDENYFINNGTIKCKFFEQPISEAYHMPVAICIDVTSTVSQALYKMSEEGVGALMVTNSEKICGIFTEKDFLSKFEEGVLDFCISDLMTESPFCVHASDTLFTIVGHMSEKNHKHIPVLNSEGEPISMISSTDIIDIIYSAGLDSGADE